MFGGNSNWRGPIWMPVNMLILRADLEDLRPHRPLLCFDEVDLSLIHI